MLEPVTDSNFDYRDLYRQLDKTKSQVFMGKQAAFFAPMMCKLEFAWSTGIETAATDAVTFWWNPQDFIRCCKLERISTVMHELWHVALMHTLRRGSRAPKAWNYACDIMINRMLRKMGYFIGPDWLDLPHLDHIKTEEELYDIVMSGVLNLGHNHCDHDHEDLEEDPRKVTDMVQTGVTNAKAEGQPGDVPGGVEELLDHFLAPIIPWEVHLYQWMNDLARSRSSWARPNRRYTNMYMPSRTLDDGRLEHLIYYEDVSGSVTNQESKRFNSELKYVWETFKPKKMTVIQFDTIIQKVDEFNLGDEFAEIKIVGCGGTCLRCVREDIIERKPTAAIIFSDMQVTPMEELPFEIPLLWIATNAHGVKVPSGEIIHIKV